jgi:hypothetical protein
VGDGDDDRSRHGPHSAQICMPRTHRNGGTRGLHSKFVDGETFIRFA